MKKRISKNNRLALCVISILLIASLLSACGKKENPQEEPDPGILLGFSQIGSESAWRVGNTNDIMKKAEEYKIRLRPSAVLSPTRWMSLRSLRSWKTAGTMFCWKQKMQAFP